MDWTLLGLEMSLRHDLHFVKGKLSKLREPRVQLGKYGECWLALQAWCWFIASKFYNMYGLGFAWTWNVSSSRPSFCQKQAIQASKTKSATWQVWRMLVGAPSLMLIHSIKVLQHVWTGLCLDLKCLFVTTFILSKASYPSFEIQEASRTKILSKASCNLASMANVGWRSKPDADS